MEVYSNLKMTLKNKKEAIKAVEILKEIATKRTPESPNELKTFIADIKTKGNEVIVDDSCSLFYNTFLELIADSMKAYAVLTQNSFEAHAWHYSCNCGFSSCVDAVCNGDELTITSIVSENGNGTCPECGETIVYYDEYDPNATYYCPVCGEEMDHLEMFEGYLPEVTKETVKISA